MFLSINIHHFIIVMFLYTRHFNLQMLADQYTFNH
jgi:hypothetical protein